MKNRLINFVLAGLLLVTSFSTQFININAEGEAGNEIIETVEPTNLTTSDPVLTIEPTENSVESKEPTVAPTDTEAPVVTVEPTQVPTVKPTEEAVETAPSTIEPTIEATEQPQETTVPEIAESTATPEAIEVPSEQDSATGDEINEQTSLDFPYLSVDEAVALIEQGESLVLFMGNSEDTIYQANLNEYQAIKKGLEDEYARDGMFVLDLSTATTDNLAALKAYTYRNGDKDSIDKAYDDYANKNTDNSATVYVYNQTITNVVRTVKDDELPKGYTRENVTFIDYKTNYRIKGEFNTTDNNLGADVYKLQPEELGAYPGDLWKYGAKGRLQTFVAPVSGTYRIKLWGATGDSDLGLYVQSGPNTGRYSHGYGGGSGFTYADIELKEGESLYLALGFRNGFSFDRSYNGGGAGAPNTRGYRSGGGGAGSIYTTSIGTGNIAEYENNKEDILMVAGGGGGAEDFFHATWENNPYPCSYEYCASSYGGNGGANPTGGSSQGPVAPTSGHKFGQGQDYNSYENASTGAGGGGFIGGLSADGNTVVLKGGTGAGGSSYVNTSRMTNSTMATGTNVNVTCGNGQCWEDAPSDVFAIDESSNVSHDAGAVITLQSLKQHTLTINYLDMYDNSVVAPQYVKQYPVGDVYSVVSPNVPGYTVQDKNQEIVEGIMPDEDVVINVYYGYPILTIHYQEYDTKETLHESYKQQMKSGTPYDVESPNIDGYVRVDETQDRVQGTKTEVNEELFVYYVPKFAPTKHIAKVNGVDIPREVSDKGVQLKTGDIVTYVIEYENKRLIDVIESFVDDLPNTVEYVGNVVGDVTVNVNGQKVTFDLNVPARSKGSVMFDVRVTNTDENIPSINNWTRKDPYIEYKVTKSSSPASGTTVGYDQEINYFLTVENNGKNTINNIVVIDKIPGHLQFSWVDATYNGKYNAERNYVKFVVDELTPDQKVVLKFNARVITRLNDSSVIDIINSAKYQNYQEKVVDNKFDDDVINNGHKTNEVIHHLVGPAIEIVKSSNPENGSLVSPGNTITYTVDMINVGSVMSNYLRVTDDIPTGTTYVPGSLKFYYNGNLMSGAKQYSFTDGANFDVRYDFYSSSYFVESVSGISGGNKLTVKWTDGISLFKTANLPSGWTREDISNGVIFTSNSTMSEEQIKSFAESLVFKGSFGQNGTITINTSSTNIPNNFYTMNTGANFDIRYESAGQYFHITNIGNGISSTTNKMTITFPSALHFNAGSIPNDWSLSSNSSGRVALTYKGSASDRTQSVKNCLQSLRFEGKGDTTGSIQVEYYSDLSGFQEFGYSGTIQSYKVPYDGTYTLEVYGAQGGNNYTDGSYSGGRGGYSKGSVNLTSGTTLYVGVGGKGTNATSWYNNVWNGGYNGGGNGHSNYYSYYGNGDAIAGGGGATHIAKNNGTLSSLSGNKGSVLIVAGGGGGASRCILTGAAAGGGAGGGTSGSNGTPNSSAYSTGGNQSSAGPGGGFGYGGEGSGGGYYGGGLNRNGNGIASGAGGSGYIGGVNNGTTSNNNRTGNGYARISYTSSMKGDTHSTNLPASGDDIAVGCKFITNNGRPYTECVAPNIEVGTKATMQFQVTVNNPVPQGLTQIENVAMYETSWDNPGEPGTITDKPTKPSNTVYHPLTGKAPNVNVVKSSNPVTGSVVDLEQDIVYTLAVTNSGQGVANYVVVRDNIPVGTNYKPGSVNMDGVYNGTYCEWVLKDLKPGETRNLMFTVTVNKDTDTTQKINNHALFESYLDNPGEPGMVEKEPNNKTNEIIHKLQKEDKPGEQVTNVTVTKGSIPVDGTAIARNTDVEYSIVIENDGETTLRRIYVKDMIPEGTTFKELLPHEDATASPKVEVKQIYNEEGNFCEWCVEMLKPKDRVTLKFIVTVDKETPLKEINNIAKYVISQKGDLGNVGEIEDSKYDKVTNVITHPLIDPEVKVTKSSTPSTGTVVGRGRDITYTLTVENTGNVLANYVAVEDTIPNETTYVEHSAKTSVKTDKKSLSKDKASIQFVLYDLEPGEIRTVEFTVTVKDSTRQGDLIRNVAFYDPHITNPGEPGKDTFTPPTQESNEVNHTVDMGVDILPTGGEGWSTMMPIVGGCILITGVALYVYYKKKNSK